MLTLFDTAALLLGLSALFGWLNRRFIQLPRNVGLLAIGLVASLLLVALEMAIPGSRLFAAVRGALGEVDFTKLVMDGMLAYLLFAGALEVDLGALRNRAIPVAFLALGGTVISTFVVAAAFWAASSVLGHPLDFAWALVFGALISPTDPVAVMSTLKHAELPGSLEIELKGEALFNDGVAIVLFTILVGMAASVPGGEPQAKDMLALAGKEVGGGIGLGLGAGYLCFLALRAIDDFAVEVLITLALVTCTYALAQHLGTSGPLSVVAAGLLIGEHGQRYGMSDRTKRYVSALWTLIDEILNSVLFLLIGLEVLVVREVPVNIMHALAAVPIVLASRFLAVLAPLVFLRRTKLMCSRNVPLLTWAGVRGGISVALALSLPSSADKPLILASTYAVVLFAILVQAPTLGWVARQTLAQGGRAEEGSSPDRNPQPEA